MRMRFILLRLSLRFLVFFLQSKTLRLDFHKRNRDFNSWCVAVVGICHKLYEALAKRRIHVDAKGFQHTPLDSQTKFVRFFACCRHEGPVALPWLISMSVKACQTRAQRITREWRSAERMLARIGR